MIKCLSPIKLRKGAFLSGAIFIGYGFYKLGSPLLGKWPKKPYSLNQQV